MSLLHTAHGKRNKMPLLEAVGLLCILSAFTVVLLTSYSIHGWSDPAHWYGFGTSFLSGFGKSRLACGFPFLIHVATRLVGPLRAYLVNIPILVILILCFYWFCKTVLDSDRGEKERRVYPALLVILILFLLNRDLLIYLVNPYRDPASFLFLLVSCAAVIRYVASGGRRLWWMGIGGLALAASVTCRETSGLTIFPMGIYVLLSRHKNKKLSLFLPAFVFLAMLLVGMIPWMVHNYLISGNMMIPAQTVAKVAREDTMTAILPQSDLMRMIPKTFSYLAAHYGWFLCLMFFVGLLAAFRTKKWGLVWICAGSVLMFLLFYVNYHKIVRRYLFVLDWFTIPLMVFGIVSLYEWGWRKCGHKKVPAVGTYTVVLFLTILCIVLPLPKEHRVRLSHIRLFQKDIGELLPERARVLCERPLTGMLHCFTSTSPQTLQYLGRRQRLSDPLIWSRLNTLMRGAENHVYAALISDEYVSFVRREYDLVNEHALDASSYNLADKFQSESFRIARLARWAKRGVSTVQAATPPTEDKFILRVDAGRLSAYKRQSIRVEANDRVVDEHPLDNVNFYPLGAPTGSALAIKLVSDGPLPDRFAVSVQGESDLIDMNVNGDNIIWYANRFSPSFLRDPASRYPGIKKEGTILVPTLPGQDGCLDVRLGIVWAETTAAGQLMVTVGSDQRELARRELLPDRGWEFMTFRMESRDIEGLNTLLAFHINSAGKSEGTLYIRQIRISRP